MESCLYCKYDNECKFGNDFKIPEDANCKQKKETRRACRVCFGNGCIERPNGEVADCPARCNNGYVKIYE